MENGRPGVIRPEVYPLLPSIGTTSDVAGSLKSNQTEQNADTPEKLTKFEDAQELEELQTCIDCGDAANKLENEVPDTDEDHLAAKDEELLYKIDDIPPIHLTFLFAFQQLTSSISGGITAVFLIHGMVCGGQNHLLFTELLSSTVALTGICTFLQVTFGIRLPVIQGSSYSFLPPIAAMMATEKWRCPENCADINNGTTTYVLSNLTNVNETHSICEDDLWRPRLNELNGALITASAIQLILGCTGLIGIIMNCVGPLTITPAVSLVGLSLFPAAANAAKTQWGIAILYCALYILFALIMRNVTIPIPNWNRDRGWHTNPTPVFRFFAALLSAGLSWLLCYILTVTSVFSLDPTDVNYKARTDVKSSVIGKAQWFYMPYPGQFGWPTFGAGVFVGMLTATISSVIESLGDYYGTASVCSVPPPPKHAVNRGIAIEGFGGILSGMLGVAHGNTSYSTPIGMIKMTSVGCRICWQLCALLFIICGLCGKIGASLSIMPAPVVGGGMIIGLGMLVSVGLLPLQYIPIRAPRNMLILGISLILGLLCPFYIKENPGAVNTGYPTLDQLIVMSLSTAMCVGGLTGFLLDNIIPGTEEERGIKSYLSHIGMNKVDGTAAECNHYDLPYVSDWLKRIGGCCTYVPFLPSYQERSMCPIRKHCRGKRKTQSVDPEEMTPALNGHSKL